MVTTNYPHKPIIDLDTMSLIYETIINNCGGTPAKNGRKIYAHDVQDPGAVLQHLIVALPLCYDYETYFNKRGNLTMKTTHAPTKSTITIEFARCE